MPVENVSDHRKASKFNVNIDAVFEPSCNDNSCKGATQFELSFDFSVCGSYYTTISKAIQFANERWPHVPVTLFMYDAGSKPLG